MAFLSVTFILDVYLGLLAWRLQSRLCFQILSNCIRWGHGAQPLSVQRPKVTELKRRHRLQQILARMKLTFSYTFRYTSRFQFQ